MTLDNATHDAMCLSVSVIMKYGVCLGYNIDKCRFFIHLQNIRPKRIEVYAINAIKIWIDALHVDLISILIGHL